MGDNFRENQKNLHDQTTTEKKDRSCIPKIGRKLLWIWYNNKIMQRWENSSGQI